MALDPTKCPNPKNPIVFVQRSGLLSVRTLPRVASLGILPARSPKVGSCLSEGYARTPVATMFRSNSYLREVVWNLWGRLSDLRCHRVGAMRVPRVFSRALSSSGRTKIEET